MKYYNKKSSKKYNKKSSKKYNKKYTKKFNKKYTKKFSKKGGTNYLGRISWRPRGRFDRSKEKPRAHSTIMRPNLPTAYPQLTPQSSSPVTDNFVNKELTELMDMGYIEEDSIIALRHTDNDVKMAKNILLNLPILTEMGFGKEYSIIALIDSENDVNKAANILLHQHNVNPDFTKNEAEDFLELVEKKIGGPIDSKTNKPRDNVKHYLIGDYKPEHHVSMFGAPHDFANDGIGYFWENVLDGRGIRPTNSLFGPNDIRFANNNGPNFRDHRKEALEMFRTAYNNIKGSNS